VHLVGQKALHASGAGQGKKLELVQQARHHIVVELHAQARLRALAYLGHDHIGHHNMALYIDKPAPGFGLEPGTVFVQRLDQKIHRRAVHLGQAQGQGLTV
jgi:hypothetical protein